MNIKQQKQLIRDVQQKLRDEGMKQAELHNQMAATEFQNTVAALEHVVISLDILSLLGMAQSKLTAITRVKVEHEVTDSFVVTQKDIVLCRECYRREVAGSNQRKCGTRKYGRCSYCGLEILYPKTMDDWKREVSEAERDLNTGGNYAM